MLRLILLLVLKVCSSNAAGKWLFRKESTL